MNEQTPKSWYMNFHFLKIDQEYNRLMSNEKVVAKQEFVSTFDTMQNRMPIATYALTGLKSDCDILIWRISKRLEDIHAMSSVLQTSGLGKYLSTVKTYLGTVNGPRYQETTAPMEGEDEMPKILGRKPYLVVAPMWKNTRLSLPQNDPSKSAHLHAADSTGLDDPDHVIAYETSDPAEFRELAETWKIDLNTTTYTCILAGIKEIVDSFG